MTPPHTYLDATIVFLFEEAVMCTDFTRQFVNPIPAFTYII